MATIHQIDAVVDPGFSNPGSSAGQKLNASKLVSFVSFTQISSDSDTVIPVKDRSHATLNDMIYAIRMAAAWSNTPGSYAIGDIVTHLGKFWYCNATAAGTDIPGTSNKWTPTGAPHIS